MKTWVKVAPLCAAAVLIAGACVPPPSGGGGGTPNLNPIAVASAAPTSGNAPLSVAFDGSGSADPDGTIVSYAWNFGNGTSGTGVSATGNYPDPGVYTAVLTVTDNGGSTGTSSVTITAFGDADGDGFFVPADCDDNDPTIYPGAPDPAGDGIDQNCDGIDGEQDAAIFVNANTGANTGTCGTITEPCASISAGQTRAIAESKSAVFVAGGSYGKFTVQAGLEIRGGYGQNWQRGVLATAPTVANVGASFDASAGGPVGVIADGVNTPTIVADLQVTGIAAGAGQTSYSVLVRNSTNALVLDSLTIIGGTGGNGATGGAGSGGWSGTAGNGGNGGAGSEPGGICNTTTSGAGGSAGSGASAGGAGGKGGAVDTSCGFLGFCSNCDAQPGSPGANAPGAGGGFGIGGSGGAAATDGLPLICDIAGGPLVNGAPGSPGANGSAGANGGGGAPGLNGGSGFLGSNGLGGGGGGGGGANDCNIDDAGAGGGGGGGGGARATSGGTGGLAGAPSVGLRLENASPVLTGVTVTLGTGGNGGNGGNGAPGQPGGNGGAGGAAFERGGAGGNGGNGGTGGASGAGGGGGGGAAVGMSRDAASSPSGTPGFSGGSGGAGGAGGNAGAPGQVVNTLVA